jgi:hypothetical protein
MTVTFGPPPGGRAPDKTAAVLNLRYDATTARLQYTLRLAPGDDRIRTVWIHRGTMVEPGAARHQLYGPSQSSDGDVVLSAADRKDLAEGRLIVRFFVQDRPASATDVPLAFIP